MSRSPLNLPQTLDQVSGAFGVSEVRNASALVAARQTGFVWTRQPGVVCLATTRDYFASARANPDVVAIIATPALAAREDPAGKAVVACDKPDELYHYLHLEQERGQEQGREVAADHIEVDATAVVDPSAVLRGEVQIGPGSRIGPRVVISGPVRIGANVRVDAAAVIGCEGLYAKVVQGVRRHLPHFGGVEIGDDAFIHAGAVIVRSAIYGEATRIGAGVHIGVLSNVGHDVQVGDGATVSSNVVIAGRARVGARAWIGASSTISNMVEVGAGAEVRLGAVAIQDVPADGDVSGNFARSHARNMKRFLKECRDEP